MLRIVIILVLFIFIKSRPLTNTFDTIDLDEVYDYLTKYGYLIEKRPTKLKSNTSNTTVIDPYTPVEVETAIKDLQYMLSLPTSGKLDQDTIKAMRMPRCGVKDRAPRDLLSVLNTKITSRGYRKRMFYQSNIWRTNTYASARIYDWILSPTFKPTKLNPYGTAFAIEYALNRWSAVCNVMFRRIDQPYLADIVFSFHTDDHGDGQPFDGPGKIFAHASKTDGEVHFDDAERFTVNHIHTNYYVRPAQMTDFVQVAIHEVGHILGFNHSPNKDSVMFANLSSTFVQGANYALHPVDISLAKSRYGKCWPPKIDAIFSNTRNGKTYIAVGPFAYQFNDVNLEVEQSWPRLISQEEWSVFDIIDEWLMHEDGKVYLFSGEYYSHTRYGTFSRHLKINSKWHPNLTRVDAAFNYIDGKSYIISNNMIYKWNKNLPDNSPRKQYPVGAVEQGWPKKLQDAFPGAPNNPDTVFRWYADNMVYFFKGRYFYIWDPVKHKMTDGVYESHQWKNICDSYICQTAGYCRYWGWKPNTK